MADYFVLLFSFDNPYSNSIHRYQANIHPSISFCLGLEHIPSASGWEAGYTSNRSPVCRTTNSRTQKTIHAHIHTYIQFRCSLAINIFVLWEEAGVSDNHVNLQSSQRRDKLLKAWINVFTPLRWEWRTCSPPSLSQIIFFFHSDSVDLVTAVF